MGRRGWASMAHGSRGRALGGQTLKHFVPGAELIDHTVAQHDDAIDSA